MDKDKFEVTLPNPDYFTGINGENLIIKYPPMKRKERSIPKVITILWYNICVVKGSNLNKDKKESILRNHEKVKLKITNLLEENGMYDDYRELITRWEDEILGLWEEINETQILPNGTFGT